MANEISQRYFTTIRDTIGNLRVGLAVLLSGSAGTQLDQEITLLEDSTRDGLYYNTVPCGQYDLYIDGSRDLKLSPIWVGAGLERYGTGSDILTLRDGVALRSVGGVFLPYFEGPGKVLIEDADFSITTMNGAVAVAHDTNTTITRLFLRASGSWEEIEEGAAGSTTFAGLDDTSISSPALLDLPSYDSGDGKWHNKAYNLLGLVQSGSAETITAAWTFNAGLNTNNDILPVYSYKDSLGSLQKKFLTVNAAELWVETLVAQDTIATIGGRILVGPTTYLADDLDAASGSVFVEHNQMVFNDTVYMESGGNVEFMRIDSGVTGSEAPFEYAVERNLDGTGANTWYAGAAVFNTRQTGAGFIDIYSIGGIISGSGPTLVGNVRNSSVFYDWSEHWAIGNLDGLYGYTSDTYGVAVGDYRDGSYLTSDSSGGIKIYASGGDQRAQFSVDGSGWLGQNSAITWDAVGNASFAGHLTAATGSIAGWDIFAAELTKNDLHLRASGYIRVGTYESGAYIAGDAAGGDYRFWAGAESGSSAPFSVKADGRLRATNTYIEGMLFSTITDTDSLVADQAVIYGLQLANTGSYGDGSIERIVTEGKDLIVYGTGEATTGSADEKTLEVGDYSVIYGATADYQVSPASNWDVGSQEASLTSEGTDMSDYMLHAITGSTSNDAYDDKYNVRFRHMLDTTQATITEVDIIESRAYLDYYNGASWTSLGVVSTETLGGDGASTWSYVNKQVTVPGSSENIKFRVRTDVTAEEIVMTGTIYASVSGSEYTPQANTSWYVMSGGTTINRRGLALRATLRDVDSRKEPHLWMEPHTAAPADNAGAAGEAIYTSGSVGGKLRIHDGLVWQAVQYENTIDFPWRMISPYNPSISVTNSTDAPALSPVPATKYVQETTDSADQTNVIYRSRLIYNSSGMVSIKGTLRGWGSTDYTGEFSQTMRYRLKVNGTTRDTLVASYDAVRGWSGDFNGTEASLTLGPWTISGLTNGEGYEVLIEAIAETSSDLTDSGSYVQANYRTEALMTWVK